MSAPRGGTKWSCKHCLYEVPGVSPDFLFPYCPSCQEKQSETGSGNETSDDQKSPCSEGTTDSEVSSSGSASISPPPQSKRPNGVNNQQNQPDSLQRPPDSQQPDSHNQRPDIRQDHGASNQQGHKKVKFYHQVVTMLFLFCFLLLFFCCFFSSVTSIPSRAACSTCY